MKRYATMDNTFLKTIIGLVVFFLVCLVLLFSYHLWKARQARADLDNYLNILSPGLKVQYDDFKVNLFNRDVVLTKVTLIPQQGNWDPSTVDTLTYHLNKDKNNFITSLDLTLTGVHNKIQIPDNVLPALPGLAKTLVNTGLVSDITVNYRYRETEQDLLLKWQQHVHGLLTLGIGIILENINLANFSPMDAMHIKLKHAYLEYKDESLVKIALTEDAKRQKISPDALIANIKAMLTEKAKPISNPKLLEYINQLAIFLKTPQRIRVDTKPLPPVGVMELRAIDPNQIIDRLNLTVKAN